MSESSDFCLEDILNGLNNGNSDRDSNGSSSSSASLRNNNNNSSSRFNTLSTTSNSLTSTDNSLMQARIDHLERERVELSLQIQQRDESLRSRKIKIEQLESQLKQINSEKVDLNKVVDNLKSDIVTIQKEKDSLNSEVEKLKTQAQSQIEAEGLWTKMTAATRELRKVEDEAKEVRKERNEFAHENVVLKADIESYTEKVNELTNTVDEQKEMMTQYDSQIQELLEINDKFNTLQEEKAKMDEEIAIERNNVQIEKESLQIERQHLCNEIYDLKEQLSEAATKISQSKAIMNMSSENDDDIARIIAEGSNEALKELVDELKRKLLQSEIKRKQLHNQIQELRGNIRVFVRCRPFLPGDGEESNSLENGNTGSVNMHKDGSSLSIVGSNAKGKNTNFSFDRVFGHDTVQDDVYREVSDLVQSALDGYRVCIFCYGQTGSGKTHTMSGDRTGPSRGIIPRAVEQIITNSMTMRKDGWNIVVNFSIVELYNEEVRDLLANGSKDKDKLKISNLQGNVTTISGLNSVEIDISSLSSGMSQLESLLEQSSKNRSTACTGMNEQSSRSHALFMLDINGSHRDGTTFMRGGLRLVDLAGSERLDRTGTLTDAARLRETVNINKSLSCLADVFIALSNKSPHIPYRNSKLTMLLQDCLSGDGKALMFVNISPTNASSQETVCSLRFATQVSQVELGKAQKNIAQFIPQMANQQNTASSNVSAKSLVTTKHSNPTKQIESVKSATSAQEINELDDKEDKENNNNKAKSSKVLGSKRVAAVTVAVQSSSSASNISNSDIQQVSKKAKTISASVSRGTWR